MPQVAITDSTLCTYWRATARSPVTGFTPPFASVAPMIARSRQVTRMAHCRKYVSSVAVGSSGRMEKLRSIQPIARLRWPVSLSDR